MVTAVDTDPCSLFAPPRVKVVSGLVRRENFVPSRRLRENGLVEELKQSMGGGRQGKYSWRPRRDETNEAY